jgi:uncharacterized coiled-coil protein SlyX
MLTDERIKQMRADARSDPRCEQELWYMLMARAIEAEATAPLLARIAELEKELAFTNEMNDQLREQNDLVGQACAELEADAKKMQGFADLWYFVMDENPRGFEKIVSEWSPNQWMTQAYKLMKEQP